MAGIAASLKAEASLEVICLDPVESNIRQRLQEFNPKTIIFDCTVPHQELDLILMRIHPNLLLVGVDPSSDDALILSGQLTRVLSGCDLIRLVSDHV